MTQINYSDLNKSIEKDETDRTIPRAFHNLPLEEKRKEILEVAKSVVNIRYPQITDADIAELANINDAFINGESRNSTRDIIFLMSLANKAIVENEQLKSDLIGFTVPAMEKHVAMDGVIKSLQRPDPKASAMGRFE